MAHRNFSMIEYFNRRCSEVKPRLAFGGQDKQDWQAWRTALLAELKRAARRVARPGAPGAEVVWETVEDGLIKQRVIFDTEEHMSVPALVYLPADRQPDQKLPAILCCHGHGPYGKEAVMGMHCGDPARKQNIVSAQLRLRPADGQARLRHDGPRLARLRRAARRAPIPTRAATPATSTSSAARCWA